MKDWEPTNEGDFLLAQKLDGTQEVIGCASRNPELLNDRSLSFQCGKLRIEIRLTDNQMTYLRESLY